MNRDRVGGYGDSDWCWQDAAHGRTYRMANGRDWCPSSLHVGPHLSAAPLDVTRGSSPPRAASGGKR